LLVLILLAVVHRRLGLGLRGGLILRLGPGLRLLRGKNCRVRHGKAGKYQHYNGK